MRVKREAWRLIWLMTVAIFLIAGWVNDQAVQCEYDELNAKYQEVSAENSDLQIKVFKLETEIVRLQSQIPK